MSLWMKTSTLYSISQCVSGAQALSKSCCIMELSLACVTYGATLQPSGFSYLGAAKLLLFAARMGMNALLMMLQMPKFSAELEAGAENFRQMPTFSAELQHQGRV